MRTNYSGFALAVSMGLLVVLLGLLALSVGGLVQLGPAQEVAGMPADTVEAAVGGPVVPGLGQVTTVAYKSVLPADGAAVVAGDALFKANCAQCHAVNEKVVGPALAGITSRRRLPWLTAWVHNSAKVIASGDDYAGKVFEDNGKQQMPAFPQLSDADIKAIMTWVESQQGSAPAASGSTVQTVAAR